MCGRGSRTPQGFSFASSAATNTSSRGCCIHISPFSFFLSLTNRRRWGDTSCSQGSWRCVVHSWTSGILLLSFHRCKLPFTLLLHTHRIDRKCLDAWLIGQQAMFPTAIHFHSLTGIKSGPFLTAGITRWMPSPWSSLGPQFCTILSPLLLRCLGYTLKPEAGIYTTSTSTDSSLSHANTHRPAQVAWLTERRGEVYGSNKGETGGSDEGGGGMEGDRRWR